MKIPEKYLCQICKNAQATHSVNGIDHCCSCYMQLPNSTPADWHPVCMKIYNERKLKNETKLN